jgi:hypothetical protein
MGVWASFGVGGKDKRHIQTTVRSLIDQQGHAAAATWSLMARPQARLSLEFLNEQLYSGWEERVN